jgi:mono/diheme cytochrome c family protein
MRKVLWSLLFAVAAAHSAAAQTPVERGRYLVNGILTCGNCHTPQGPSGLIMERELSGGVQVFDEPAFKVKGANITPDRETGIGAWSAADIKKALQEGVRPNGIPLAPIMPAAFYKILTPGDLDAIVAYVRSVKPVRNEVPPPEYKTAVTQTAYPGGEKPYTEADMRDPVKKGFYLATIGHCMECHTPNGDAGPLYSTALGKGGREFLGPWGKSVSANITADPEAGLGRWSDAEIKRAITQGISRDGHRLKPPMLFSAYARLTPEDLNALVAWLRTVPPRK